MKKLILFVSLLLPLLARADEPAAPSPDAALDWFLGGTWIATLPPRKDGTPVRIELNFTKPDNKNGVRFESSFFFGDKRAPYTCGMYAWNAVRQKYVIFYTDSSGSVTTGDVTLEGALWLHELTASAKSGKAEPIQVRLTKVSADAFTNDIYIQKDGAWTPFISVRYERRQ
ncbi:MAG TPA: hypothetical protein VFJ90_11235 [Candidatus Didemnitutus sp.]|nr:hypothetical protein [Candidatus Didemnitutus sp.]